MSVRQISVFLENRSGRLAEVTKALGDAKIDISAICISDTTECGILRLIVNQPDRALSVLKENGFTATTAQVLAIALDNAPGAIANAFAALHSCEIGVDYVYAFVGKTDGKALVILKVSGDYATAGKVLSDAGIKVLKDEEVYSL